MYFDIIDSIMDFIHDSKFNEAYKLFQSKRNDITITQNKLLKMKVSDINKSITLHIIIIDKLKKAKNEIKDVSFDIERSFDYFTELIKEFECNRQKLIMQKKHLVRNK